ncbi:phosphoribosylaminoimidazolesuccinocarboxamide synthase [candidate division KSB1 bacterium]|nr:phosphoribosylaminoimidazolesuccinocarboxamide synthase [candidate division KSB1 bacterium]NIR70150.1 phosphoribosylaminoimidazolesuccinocarboxamide synthase [candidate division KSB1 bacterium]NIS28062.1 phosphoribosylaminoimidazolesuccinocarboxamide synthase [candidate division KSB1 bacterium]NIT74931.1 phosphoribosylaminoimidazolesuccinocarboxamide synthase [candidate division KSB1 bacterium]NIU28715.1 phosphoribosylaminoimidazolesuccinocarboxamide synthase [candidate division KSB1 bacteri
MSVKKKQKLYEGKAKIVYETDKEDLLIQEFKDDATAFDGAKKGKIKSKGVVNNQISSFLFNYLDSYHVPTHFVSTRSDNSMVIRKLEMIPVEVVMRNIATGSLVKRYGVEEGKELEQPVLEYYLKDDEKHDPMVNEHHVVSFGHATQDELKQIERFAYKINAVLKAFFFRRDLKLVDFKLEFGRNKNGKIVLGDEISPDTCRFWDAQTDEKLDKDRFRQDLGKIEEAYQEVRNRVFKEA